MPWWARPSSAERVGQPRVLRRPVPSVVIELLIGDASMMPLEKASETSPRALRVGQRGALVVDEHAHVDLVIVRMPPHPPRADGVLHHDGGPREAEEQPLAFVRHRVLAGGAGLPEIDEERVVRGRGV